MEKKVLFALCGCCSWVIGGIKIANTRNQVVHTLILTCSNSTACCDSHHRHGGEESQPLQGDSPPGKPVQNQTSLDISKINTLQTRLNQFNKINSDLSLSFSNYGSRPNGGKVRVYCSIVDVFTYIINWIFIILKYILQ